MPSRLLSIELQGYKTFASRYKFDFPGVITCVVGPNGSGKSNVADAIRWVLGEQSFNLLRARKTEDMIFSGSSQRPRAGMASVTISFDNIDSWFPLEFSEVAITRRAYRDGQNEYYLNNQKVRLKEIIELLAQGGVTPRTYTIIGQGLVDAALSLRPDERREFFEEAAGISIHRKRRDEAIHRLQNSKDNLERVTDILNELKPRLVSLEKQAHRAVEYERLRADLRLLMKDWYGYHWHQSQIELQHSREVLRAQEAILEATKKDKETLDQAFNNLRNEMNSLRGDASGWHQESAVFHRQTNSLNRSSAVLEERLRSFGEQIDFLSTEMLRFSEEEKSNQQMLIKETSEKDAILAEKQSIMVLISESEKKFNQLNQQKQLLLKEKDHLDNHLKDLETEKVRLQSQIQELSLQKDRHLASKSVLDSEKAALMINHDGLENETNKLHQEISSIQSEYASNESALKNILEETIVLDGKQTQLLSQISTVENSISKKNAQLEVYKNSISSSQYYFYHFICKSYNAVFMEKTINLA